MNALGFEYADGYNFDHTGDGIDEAKFAAEQLPFHKYNLPPHEHGLHPSQRVEVDVVVTGDWTTKTDGCHGAVHKASPYRRPGGPPASGFSGYTPLWRPPDNPLDGGKSADLYSSGAATYSGYMGNRPGEKADPFIAGKVNVDDARGVAPWQGEPRDGSMAARIAQRRLAAANTRKAAPYGPAGIRQV